jgi:hypothetical protein
MIKKMEYKVGDKAYSNRVELIEIIPHDLDQEVKEYVLAFNNERYSHDATCAGIILNENSPKFDKKPNNEELKELLLIGVKGWEEASKEVLEKNSYKGIVSKIILTEEDKKMTILGTPITVNRHDWAIDYALYYTTKLSEKERQKLSVDSILLLWAYLLKNEYNDVRFDNEDLNSRAKIIDFLEKVISNTKFLREEDKQLELAKIYMFF